MARFLVLDQTEQAAPPPSLAKSASTISILTLASRLTGFVRILVVTNVLGALLGDVYQSANTVPNLVFELFVAGALQAVLVPTLVRIVDGHTREEVNDAIGRIMGAVVVVATGLFLLALLLVPAISSLLLSRSKSGDLYQDQLALTKILLVVFLPQVVFYAVGLISSAILNAKNRFGIAAAAPLLNNLVVISCYVLFGIMHGHDSRDLTLTASEILVLGGGTTLGVIVFTSAPLLAVFSSGIRPKLSVKLRDPLVVSVAKSGAWATVVLACLQLVTFAAIVLMRSVEGAVAGWQVAYALFLLPVSIVALPVFTAVAPQLARTFHSGEDESFYSILTNAIAVTCTFLVPLAIALAMCTQFVAGTIVRNSVANRVVIQVPPLALGVIGFSLFQLFVRASYARDNTRLPSVVIGTVTIAGLALMIGVAPTMHGDLLLRFLSWCLSGVFVVSAAVLGFRLLNPAKKMTSNLSKLLIRIVLGAIACVLTIELVKNALQTTSNDHRLTLGVVMGLAGLIAFILVQRIFVSSFRALIDFGSRK